jgi:N utilization substance protein B
MDKRHIKRMRVMQNLYAWSFNDDFATLPNEDEIEKTKDVIAHLEEIDKLVNTYSEKFEIGKIAKTDLAILRLSTYELTVEKKLPPKVVIDEAVELAKEVAGEKSYGFINAILGKIYTSIEPDTETEKKPK